MIVQRVDGQKAVTPIAYVNLLKHIEGKLGRRETYSDDLDRLGREYCGSLWGGVWAADDHVWPTAERPVLLRNTDVGSGEGVHWVGEGWDNGRIVQYDSFGRTWRKMVEPGHTIVDNRDVPGGRYEMTDRDHEQRENETNCGPRSLAWCLLFLIDRETAMRV